MFLCNFFVDYDVTSNPFNECCGCGIYTSVRMSWRGTPFLLSFYCTPNTHIWGDPPCYSYIDLQILPLEFGHASNLVFL